jgi:hypothetical protein
VIKSRDPALAPSVISNHGSSVIPTASHRSLLPFLKCLDLESPNQPKCVFQDGRFLDHWCPLISCKAANESPRCHLSHIFRGSPLHAAADRNRHIPSAKVSTATAVIQSPIHPFVLFSLLVACSFFVSSPEEVRTAPSILTYTCQPPPPASSFTTCIQTNFTTIPESRALIF